ncbi:hypothetical protein Tco_1074113 [Tanacetum coccineum]
MHNNIMAAGSRDHPPMLATGRYAQSKITQHEGTSLQRRQRPRPHELNDKSNLIDLKKECHNELTSGEIVSLKILRDDRDAILEGVDFGDIPQLDGIEVPPYVCNMGKSSRNKKKPCGNYKMTYSDEGPSLTMKKSLTHEEITREALEKDMYKRILILQEPRPIIKTLKFSDQHKKLLDSVMLDKLKLDGQVEIDEEEAIKEVIRGYKTIREKNNPRVFVLHILTVALIDVNAAQSKVNAAGKEVSTAELVSAAYVICMRYFGKGYVFSTWMAFGGNTCDLGSFGEETNEITDLHQNLEEVLLTERGDGVTGIKRRHRDPSSDGIRT